MKQPLLAIILMVSVLYCSATFCNRNKLPAGIENNNMHKNMTSNKINIKVGSKVFTATLLNNNSAKALSELLPFTLNMTELNGNEKYGDLSKSLPTNSSNPGTLKNGDVMLYGSNTLVLFYKSFSTAYSYTKLGMVDDTTGLALALGSGNISVTFEAGK